MGDSGMYVKSDDISVKLCKAFNKLQMDDIAVSKAVKHLRKLHDENVEDGPAPLSEQIGRIPMVSLHPKSRERFFLRLLLGHIRGM